LEDSTAPCRATTIGRTVQVAVAGLDETGSGETALGVAIERMHCGQPTGGRELEDGAEPEQATLHGRTIQIAIARLEEAGLRAAALGGAVKGVQYGERSARGDLEYSATPGGAARGRAVEVAIAGLDDAVRGAAGPGAAVEGMERGESAVR